MVKQVLPVIALSEDGSWMFEMFRDLWVHQIAALQPKYELKYVTKKQEAKQLLSSGSVRASLAFEYLVAAVVKECGFLEAGGTVIFCGPMSGNTSLSDFPVCFSQLGLPWTSDAYYRADFYAGPAAQVLGIRQHAYNCKALLAGKVATGDIVFGPTDESVSQSLVFAPQNVGAPNVASVAFAATKGGYVGYLGDVNAEEESSGIVLAMLQKGEAARAPAPAAAAAAATAAAAGGGNSGAGSRGRVCRACGARDGEGVSLMRCARCRVDRYCSRECQRADWPRHKQGCTPASS